ncbi:MAG: M48 family metallopeptidase [Candidatus Gracilibacteria bacterium]
MYTTIFYIILGLFIFEFLFSKILSYLNTLNWSTSLPKELKAIYDAKKYKKSMKYEKDKYDFGNISGMFSFLIMYFVLVFGLFGGLYDFVSIYTSNEILRTLYFFGIIVLIQTIIGLPFSYYSTFVIEEKFGFNKMTKKIFFIDIFKSLLLSGIIGGLLLALITWFYLKTGANFWLYTWGLVTFFSVFMMMFYSSLIVPIFNKQTPLKKGSLRSAIEKFATSVGFKLDNIYVIDGSKRSSKANAYFSGFGPKKRIVLYDTLINDLTDSELVGVLAHEIGHYKRKHTIKMLALGVIQTGLMLYILGLALDMPAISHALGSTTSSFAVGMVAFGILYTPISIFFGLIGNICSRKNEYEADEFAGINHDPKKLKNALIKLSRNNLSNLRPHPLFEFFNYSHPTVLKRLKFLDNIKKK